MLCGDGERDLRVAKAGFDERARTSRREGEERSLPTRPEVEGRDDEPPTFRAAAAAAARGAVADAALRDELALLPLVARLLDRALDIEEAIAEVQDKRIKAGKRMPGGGVTPLLPKSEEVEKKVKTPTVENQRRKKNSVS